MLDRLSVSILLRSVIAALATALVLVLVLGACESWTRLAASRRIAAVADASAHMFTALHNLAVDRACTARGLVAEKPATAMNDGLRQARAAAMPALTSAVAALAAIDFPEPSGGGRRPGRTNPAADCAARGIRRCVPAAEARERRPGLAQKHFAEADALIATLDRLSARLNQLGQA